MAYEHHSQRLHTAIALRAIAEPDIPAKVKPLLAVLVRMSRNGQKAVFATAEFLARQIGRVVSTYYEHRKILVELGLITVEERRCSYDASAPSLITVASVKRMATDYWRKASDRLKAAREARKSAPPENRRQKGANKNISSSIQSVFAAFRSSTTPKEAESSASPPINSLRLDFIERWGITPEQFDAIPDAAPPQKKGF